MSDYDPEKYRIYYQANKAAIALRRKLRRQKRKVSGKLKKERAARRVWWHNMAPEKKAIALAKRRDYWQKWRQANPEKIREKDRRIYQKQKEKELRQYATRLKYERAHPDRCKKYYKENKAKVDAQKKIYLANKKPKTQWKQKQSTGTSPGLKQSRPWP